MAMVQFSHQPASHTRRPPPVTDRCGPRVGVAQKNQLSHVSPVAVASVFGIACAVILKLHKKAVPKFDVQSKRSVEPPPQVPFAGERLDPLVSPLPLVPLGISSPPVESEAAAAAATKEARDAVARLRDDFVECVAKYGHSNKSTSRRLTPEQEHLNKERSPEQEHPNITRCAKVGLAISGILVVAGFVLFTAGRIKPSAINQINLFNLFGGLSLGCGVSMLGLIGLVSLLLPQKKKNEVTRV
eukprot:GHVT01037704.1.p1 GENE.GHVT01037704.1~~GHVT01037704.1.p1  ORF type:complete len:243 (-),score=32.57 GHVT01037704.1:163-891(-)